MLDALIAFLQSVPLGWAVVVLFLQNLVVFGLALGCAHLLRRRYRDRRVTAPAPALGRLEIGLAALTILLNTAITFAGLLLWREGIITFTRPGVLRALLDAALLFFVMDAAMYVLHRLGHLPLFYPLLHRTHHRFDRPRPLTLFVLNPAETLSFGVLWLAVVSLYDASWLGMAIYLVLNVVFGAVGHLGVEPLPGRWPRIPVLGALTGATFHGQHHGDLRYNYGFYTTLWDRLFGTLAPDYEARFEAAASAAPPRPFPEGERAR